MTLMDLGFYLYLGCPSKALRNFVFIPETSQGWKSERPGIAVDKIFQMEDLVGDCYLRSYENQKRINKMAKHTQTIRRQFADELFECVWPFCGIGA